MKFNFKDIDKNWKTYAMAGCCCILFLVVLLNIPGILAFVGKFIGLFNTVIVGAVLAYVANPLAALFERRVFKAISKPRLKWTLSVVAATIIILAILVVLLALIVPQILESFVFIADNISKLITKLQESSADLDTENNVILTQLKNFVFGTNGLIERLGYLISDNMTNIIKATSSVGSTAASTGIGFIMAFYFLMAKDEILKNGTKLFTLILSPTRYEKSVAVLGRFNGIFTKYIVCEILDSLIVGLLNYFFMLVVSMPSAAFVSVIVGVTNLAPTFGPLVGAVLSILVLLLINPKYILLFLIFTAVLQTLDGYLIKPRLFGGVLDVPGLLILIFIIVFGNMLGVIGMLIAIPASAIFVYLYDGAFIPWLKAKREKKDSVK